MPVSYAVMNRAPSGKQSGSHECVDEHEGCYSMTR
jgi:hypothetical protein